MHPYILSGITKSFIQLIYLSNSDVSELTMPVSVRNIADDLATWSPVCPEVFTNTPLQSTRLRKSELPLYTVLAAFDV